MGGVAVRARAGRRDAYRPLESALCPGSSRPEAVVEGFLALHSFRRFYVADLDAILGRGGHDATLEALARAFPALEFWVDAGFPDPAAAAAWQARGLGRPVLGSESLAVAPGAAAMPAQGVLSLDFRDDGFLGPAGLDGAVERWPGDVIAMTLGRVGMGRGPDLETLSRLRRLAPGTRLHAAGGVRHAGDLAALAALGVAGVLLASALHDGRISPGELAAFHDELEPGPSSAARESAPAPDR